MAKQENGISSCAIYSRLSTPVTDLLQRPEVSAWVRWLPPIGWLSEYRMSWLPRDIVAGVTLAA
jgi:hypothetical protein